MARRRRQDSNRGSLDSLLDTMTNVVGILIVVLIVTQVNVSSAAKRIRANLPDVTVKMMEDLRKKDEELKNRLEELKQPQDVSPEDLREARDELRRLLAEREKKQKTAEEVVDLEKQRETLRQEIEAITVALSAEGGELAQIRSKIEADEGELADQKPKLVRLPNPRSPDEGSQEVRMIVRGQRLLHYDRAAILNAIAAKVTPRKDLLSRKPEFKNRYDRDKIAKHLEGLKEMDPNFRFEFILHKNGHIHVHIYPRDGAGETLEELANPASEGRRVMAQAFGDRNYIRYLVTQDSFEEYVAARRMAEKIQIPVGWIFAEDSARHVVNLSERKIVAEPHPDYKPPEPKPGQPTPKPKPKVQEDILD